MQTLSNFIPQSIEGSLSDGGWVAKGKISADMDVVSFGDNLQIQALNMSGGIIDSDYATVFDGHCLSNPQNIAFDKYTSTADVLAGTANNLLKGYLQDIGFTEQASPTNDHQMTDLSFAAIAEHIMERHCNAIYDATDTPDGIIKTTYVDDTNSVTTTIKNVRASNNLWGRVQQIGGGDESSEFYYSYMDRLNRWHYEKSPFFQLPTPTSRGTITSEHIWGTPVLVSRQSDVTNIIGQVDLRTKAPDAATYYYSTYPATAGEGKIYQLHTGVFANSQAKSDDLAERLYKWLTREWTLKIQVDPNLILFGDDGYGLDIGQAVSVTYAGPADTGGNGVSVEFDEQKFYIYQASVQFDNDSHEGVGSLTLEVDNG